MTKTRPLRLIGLISWVNGTPTIVLIRTPEWPHQKLTGRNEPIPLNKKLSLFLLLLLLFFHIYKLKKMFDVVFSFSKAVLEIRVGTKKKEKQ